MGVLGHREILAGAERVPGLRYNQMVVDMRERTEGERADRLFRALSDPTRRDIVRRTLDSEYSVSGLARRYPMSFAAVQKHVAVLAAAGLVTKRRQGREQLVRGEVDTLQEAGRLLDQLESVWRGRIERIGEVLADDKTAGGKRADDKTEGATP
jgi:DNA-binding transcriptional ArsR family regulator